MNETIVYKKYNNEYYGEITKFIDRYLISEADKRMMEQGYCLGTYLWGLEQYDDFKGTAFRFPGATRGHIELDDNNVITAIKFYGDTCFGEARLNPLYDRKIENDIKVFLGKKLIFKE